MTLKAPAPVSESNEPEFEQSRQGEVFEARIHVPGPEHDWSSHAADAFGRLRSATANRVPRHDSMRLSNIRSLGSCELP
jgi:hypothetical protein